MEFKKNMIHPNLLLVYKIINIAIKILMIGGVLGLLLGLSLMIELVFIR